MSSLEGGRSGDRREAGAADPLLVRLGLAVFFALLLFLCVRDYAADREGRRAVEAFAQSSTLAERLPLYLETSRLAPAADLAAAVMADAALEDTFGVVRLNGLPAPMRALWIEAASRRDEELAAAQRLERAALASRPGWAIHAFLLGKLAYAEARRDAGGSGSFVARWREPLLAATRGAPGLQPAWLFLAGAELESWLTLGEDARREAPAHLERAFRDPQFVVRAFVTAVAVLGRDRAANLLPDSPSALEAARELLGHAGDVAGYAVLQERWERAEIRAREKAVAAAEERAHVGDVAGLDAACRAFVTEHPPRQFDRRPERQRAARILELWPPDVTGGWREDARGDLVRYFLDGRLSNVSGPALSRSVAALSSVPEPVRATAFLLGADVYDYDKLLRESTTVGSLSWTSFFVRLARAELEAGRADGAHEALGRIAASARGECDVLLARRDVARREGDAKTLAEIEPEIRKAAPRTLDPAPLVEGTLPLCVDPATDSKLWLAVGLSSPQPAYVAYGFDGGRVGSALVSGDAVLRVPLEDRAGRCSFFLRTLAGSPPKARQVELVSADSSGSSLLVHDAEAQPAPSAQKSAAGIAGSEKLNSPTP